MVRVSQKNIWKMFCNFQNFSNFAKILHFSSLEEYIYKTQESLCNL
jgi:hypothetical protein